MSLRFQSIAVLVLVLATFVGQLSVAEEPLLGNDEFFPLGMPIGIDMIEVEAFEQGSLDLATLDAFAWPIVRIASGGTGGFEAAANLIGTLCEMVFEAVAEAEDPADVEMWVDQMQPMVVSELKFVRLICSDLTIEQRAQVRKAAAESLKRSATRVFGNIDNNDTLSESLDSKTDPLVSIRESIADALKQILTSEQFGSYMQNASQRATQRKQAAILGVVSRLDGQLLLTAEQRNKMIDAISTQWRPNWEHWLGLHGSEEQPVPVIPDQIMAQCLDDLQMSVWHSVEKFNSADLWGSDFGDVQFDDEWWGENEPIRGLHARGAGVGFF